MFKALWNGEYQSDKCTSESEADLALMGKLLYWCSVMQMQPLKPL
ncbi:hypothetical protein [Acetivibrio saccincola]|nr:hypothetical protein [Acetivibrio saccincola]